MLEKIKKLYLTLKYLKPIQIRYQIRYRIKNKLRIRNEGSIEYSEVLDTAFVNYIYNNSSLIGKNHFRFINIEHQFDTIDWNYSVYAKLWTYNLNYFDYLNQENTVKEEGIALLHQFIKDYDAVKDGKEPYPTSLRIINTIKFVLSNQIKDEHINELVAKDAYTLGRNLEYHLLANHLLENTFALFMAGIFLKNTALYKKGESLLKKELNEQILEDGAHFELSPMYHQLMLYRVLDCIQLCSEEHKIHSFLVEKAEKMYSWLRHVSFSSGAIPLVNDAANNINPTSKQIFYYAEKLGIKESNLSLKDSGYRMIRKSSYELFLDVGNIQPSYQPGHAHADTFSFVLYQNDNPFIVDTGTSTYNIGKQRTIERSTSSHNTVTVNGGNSSQVWSGFRVAKRAKVTLEEEKENTISAKHNGFAQPLKRNWKWSENRIQIEDKFNNDVEAEAFLHFHPDVKVLSVDDKTVQTNRGKIQFNNSLKVELLDYKYAPAFNTLIPAKKLKIQFKQRMLTEIIL